METNQPNQSNTNANVDEAPSQPDQTPPTDGYLAAEKYVPVSEIKELGAYQIKNPLPGVDEVISERAERAEEAYKKGAYDKATFEQLKAAIDAEVKSDRMLGEAIDNCTKYADSVRQKIPLVSSFTVGRSISQIAADARDLLKGVLSASASPDEKATALNGLNLAIATLVYRAAHIEAGALRIKRRIRSNDYISASRFQEIIDALSQIDIGLHNPAPIEKTKEKFKEEDGWKYSPLPAHIPNDLSLLYVEAIVADDHVHCVCGPDVNISLEARFDDRGSPNPYLNLTYNKYEWQVIDNHGRRLGESQITAWRYATVANIEMTPLYANQEKHFNELLGDYLSAYQQQKVQSSGLILPK